MTFKHSGTVTISSLSSIDVIGYLCDEAGCDTDTGEPYSILTYNDDAGGDFDFSLSYDVEAGKTYHLYFRGINLSTSGSVTIIIMAPGASNRPEYFHWHDGAETKVKGQDFDITAADWGRFLDHINLMREYRGYNAFPKKSAAYEDVASFSYPSKGDDFLALHFNQALMGIAGIAGDGTGYYEDNVVSPGDDITAAAINFLVELINTME